MLPTSRRTFLAGAAGLTAATRALFARDPLTHSNLGVQLYTVRKIILNNPAEVLKRIQDIGYAEVEATYDNLDKIWPALHQTNLKAVSVHVDARLFTGDSGTLDTALGSLKDRGFEYVVLPYYETTKNGLEGVKRAAELMNKAGKQVHDKGLTFCYHNHAHDFQPIDGTPALERILKDTDPDLVHLEMDIFWVSVAGQDPVELLKAYNGRVPLLHLKDKARDVPKQFSERVPPNAFKAIGSGSLNIPAILSAADSAGVRHYFVEQDQTPGDPIASLQKSFNYLRSHFKS